MARLYVGNLPHMTSEPELQAWIESQGFKVETVQVIKDLDTGESRGFAFAELPEVINVHDLHAWTLTSELPMLSAHVTVKDGCMTDGTAPRVLNHLQECLVGHFDVEHSTFQLEPERHVGKERRMHL